MATTPAPVPTTPIPIRLRVVGIFYEQTFDFADITGGKTIKDLLDLAVRRGNSTPVATAGGTPVQQSVFSYATKVMHKPASKPAALFNSLLGFTHNLVAPLDPSLGNKPRKAGTYKLFESTSVENGSVTVHAWQYYIIRDKKVFSNFYDGASASPDVSPADPNGPVAAGSGTPGFTPFDEVTLLPGDEVVWRNVSIVRNPQVSN